MSKIKKAVLSSICGAVNEPEPGTVTGQFKFPEDFIGFSGHFPGFPILPAYVQVLVAQTLVESVLGRSLQLQEIVNAKFLLPIRPGQVLEACCTRTSDQDHLRWTAMLSADAQKAASFQLIFTESSDQ